MYRIFPMLAILLLGSVSAQNTTLQFGQPMKSTGNQTSTPSNGEDFPLLTLEKERIPRELAEGAEVFLITGFKAEDKGHGNVVKVEIDRPQKVSAKLPPPV